MPHRDRLHGPALAGLGLVLAATGCAVPRSGIDRVPDVPSMTSPSLPPISVEGYVTAKGVYHLVQPGQTMWRIAKIYGIPLDEVATANGIEDPTILLTGQTLFIPGAEAILDVPPYPAPLTGILEDPPLRDETTAVNTSGFAWPVPAGRVVSGYGVPRRTHRHRGLDIGAEPGEPVLAAQAGRVVYSGSTLRGYGKTVILDHGDRLRTLYAHNSALVVREGDWVERGQAVARVGRTGNATGEHCHFEIRKNGVPVNPLAYLPKLVETER